MLVLTADHQVATNALLADVCRLSGVRVQDCYQCGKCTAGCVVAAYMDLTPRQVMRAVQLGQSDLVLRSSAIWLCASCHTCSARCPMELDVARVMDSLRHLCQARGVPATEKDVALTHGLFLHSVRRLGRVYEVGVVAGLNVLSRRPFANVLAIGLPLLAKGKLNLLPARSGGTALHGVFAAARDPETTARRESVS